MSDMQMIFGNPCERVIQLRTTDLNYRDLGPCGCKIVVVAREEEASIRAHSTPEGPQIWPCCFPPPLPHLQGGSISSTRSIRKPQWRTVLAKYLSQASRTGPAALSPLPCLAARLAFRAVSGVRCGQLSCSGQWKGRRGTCWKPECDSRQSCVLFFHHGGNCGTEARMAWGEESCPHPTDQCWEPLRSGTLWRSYYCHYWYPESCSWLNTEKLDLIWGEDRWPSISSCKFQVLRNTGKGDLCVIPCVQETLSTARDPVIAIIY